jgi:hypothetical protein
MSARDCPETAVLLTEVTAEVMRQVLYETVLDRPVPDVIMQCIDSTLNRLWRVPSQPDAALARLPKLTQTVRRAHDNCLAASNNHITRMVGQVRRVIENQVRHALVAAQFTLARSCLKKAVALPQLKACPQKSTGQPLSDTEWERWTVLYSLKRDQQ